MMFTGIIQELGTVERIKTVKDAMQLTIRGKNILKNINLGDSIAINGVCLTVTAFDSDCFTLDVMPETYKATSLSKLKVDAKVNLEPALSFDGRIGGHFVTGHIDGVGEIIKIREDNNAVNYQIKLSSELLQYCILKGSIAVDGTSLTIFALDTISIGISLIPHTMKNSVLGQKKVGDIVNIECDMLGKYVVNLLLQRSAATSNNSAKLEMSTPIETKINTDFLQQHGFV